MSDNIVELDATSVATRRAGDTFEMWFLTEDNISVRFTVPSAVMHSLAQRIAEMTRPQD